MARKRRIAGMARPASASRRRMALELKLGWGAPWILVPLGLVVLTLMHTGLGGGSSQWARHWGENCEAFVPLGFGIGSASLLLVEHDEGMLEMAAPLPMPRVARARMLVLVGGAWLLVLLWLAVLRVAFGPVPFATGLAAALGPGLLLGGGAALVASASGRVALGYLVAIGLPVMDLVLQLLGVFYRLPPLEMLNVFAYRWPTPLPGWVAVKAVMGLAGLWLYARAIRGWRDAGTELL